MSSGSAGSAESGAPEVGRDNVTAPSAAVSRKLWLLVGMMKYAKEIDDIDSLPLYCANILLHFIFKRNVRVSALFQFIWRVLQSGTERI